ncbi:MAG: TonB-dependent receptor plug domain-containing protein [Bacteroidota bacterium]|nr:TonB-dependent receptor plug domain-containing protein [Bacteroidota bacterium]
MRNQSFLSIMVFMLFSASLIGQDNNRKITITGRVVDVSLYPVANAIVLIDGQNSGILTNSDGKYRVIAKINAGKIGILTPENGFAEIPINGMTRINFQLYAYVPFKQKEMNIDQDNNEVSIGYNSIRKNHLATQIKEINGNKAKYASYSSIYEVIQNEVPGIRISGTKIIMPVSDYYHDWPPALLIVDGVYVDSFSGIPPSAVESIAVLKGASAAIYGTRGYGGAVLVTTTRK